MAVSTSTINSFAAVGTPMAVSEFNPFESTVHPKRTVGFKVEDLQGNVYRWGHFGAAVTQGKVVSQDISESSVVDSDDVILAPASCQNTDDGKIGSRFIELTLASVTRNQYAGGKIVITDDTGKGYTYNILGNTATGDPATGTIRLELQHPLQVAVNATSDYCISGSRYGNLEGATATDFDVVGVTLASQDANDYGWVGTKGCFNILTDSLTFAGKGINVGTVVGSVSGINCATNDNVFGYCLAVGDDTGYAPCVINCE